MKNAIIFIIALAVSNLAVAESPAQIYGKYAAPFGLEWGMSKEKLAEMGVKLTPYHPIDGAYNATILPKNLSDAARYGLIFKQGFGLVKIAVHTNEVTSDLYGSKGKERYSQLKTAIINKYGAPKSEGEHTGNSHIYEDSHQFYQCLMHDGCGDWASHWGNETDGIILLRIYGVAPGIGYVSLDYRSAAFYTAVKQESEEQSRSDEDAL